MKKNEIKDWDKCLKITQTILAGSNLWLKSIKEKKWHYGSLTVATEY